MIRSIYSSFFILSLMACGGEAFSVAGSEAPLNDAADETSSLDETGSISDSGSNDSGSEINSDANQIDSGIAPESSPVDTGVACVPRAPSEVCGSDKCGTHADSCGGSVSCGTCSADQDCVRDAGGPATCRCRAPVSCSGLTCGDVTSCGMTINCGTCPLTKACGFKTPNQCDGCKYDETLGPDCFTMGTGRNFGYVCDPGFHPPTSHCTYKPSSGAYCCDI